MLERAKRASHIDPPASSYAIMRRACPYCGENRGPGKDFHRELDPTPGIREQPRPLAGHRPVPQRKARPSIKRAKSSYRSAWQPCKLSCALTRWIERSKPPPGLLIRAKCERTM